jgi:alkanesulfonate monooxygenase SsuD/methylene tetrahydromethanopterin reductase-like flavin-dependent oxidoreductase (luciferase family)
MPYAELYHHESATRGYEDDPTKQARFAEEVAIMRKRWGPLLDNDPSYNPNLDLKGKAFGLDPGRVAPFPACQGVVEMHAVEFAPIAGDRLSNEVR